LGWAGCAEVGAGRGRAQVGFVPQTTLRRKARHGARARVGGPGRACPAGRVGARPSGLSPPPAGLGARAGWTSARLATGRAGRVCGRGCHGAARLGPGWAVRPSSSRHSTAGQSVRGVRTKCPPGRAGAAGGVRAGAGRSWALIGSIDPHASANPRLAPRCAPGQRGPRYFCTSTEASQHAWCAGVVTHFTCLWCALCLCLSSLLLPLVCTTASVCLRCLPG
jgi:hypothetical protein